MSIGILGKKLGMSQLFDDKGNSVPVTLIEAGPCRITQLKTTALDGYTAVQIGYGLSKEKHISKPEKGHLLKSGEELLKHLKEYRVKETSSYAIGKQITTKGLLVLKIDDQKNLLVVKGSVPGKPGSLVNIKPNNVVGKKGGKIS